MRLASAWRRQPPVPADSRCRTQTPSSLFFQYNNALGPPYQVLIDTNFINFSIKNKLDIVRAMMDCLLAKCAFRSRCRARTRPPPAVRPLPQAFLASRTVSWPSWRNWAPSSASRCAWPRTPGSAASPAPTAGPTRTTASVSVRRRCAHQAGAAEAPRGVALAPWLTTLLRLRSIAATSWLPATGT